jgi:hypothetical protein
MAFGQYETTTTEIGSLADVPASQANRGGT